MLFTAKTVKMSGRKNTTAVLKPDVEENANRWIDADGAIYEII